MARRGDRARAAEIFGREASIFVPSGSMGNLIAVKTWTHHGDEVIIEERGHIHQFEMDSITAIAGCMPRTTYVEDGILSWDIIEPLIRPKVYYRAQTALVSLESSHNMAGGTVYPPEVSDEICDRDIAFLDAILGRPFAECRLQSLECRGEAHKIRR